MGLFSNQLEPYTGKYLVGTHDLEIELPVHKSFGTALLLRTLQPALILETTLVTLFYPTKPPSSNSSNGKNRMNWLERPLTQTASGYSKFVNKPIWMVLPALYLLASGVEIPAIVDGELADKLKVGQGEVGGEEEKLNSSGTNTPSTGHKGTGVNSSGSSTSEEGTLIDSESDDNQFPLIIFSHGLGGSRTTYSQYCGELASRGNIVAIIEHRDGSGPITIVKKKDGGTRLVDYIKPDQDLIFNPPNPKLSAIEFRKEQLLMRTEEISTVLQLLTQINQNGSGENNKLGVENMRRVKGGNVGILDSWKGRINLVKDVSMVGHSFGGATTLQVLRAGKTYPFTRGIVLDPWIDPIPPLSSPTSSSLSNTSAPAATSPNSLGTDIKVPLLVFNSETFTMWTEHYKQVRRITEGLVGEEVKGWLMSLVGSIHLSFSDFPLLQPYIAKKAGARVDPKLAISLFVEASNEFLLEEYKSGKILSGKVIPGDERGVRDGEGYKRYGGKPMEKVGEVRMHVNGNDA